MSKELESNLLRALINHEVDVVVEGSLGIRMKDGSTIHGRLVRVGDPNQERITLCLVKFHTKTEEELDAMPLEEADYWMRAYLMGYRGRLWIHGSRIRAREEGEEGDG